MRTYQAPEITTIGSLADMTLATFPFNASDNLSVSINGVTIIDQGLPGTEDINISLTI